MFLTHSMIYITYALMPYKVLTFFPKKMTLNAVKT
jgi:hypothetical protein